MKLHVDTVGAWYPGCEDIPANNVILSHLAFVESTWPKLDFVPPMQRRRLSSFAKIALYSAHQATLGCQQDLPMVFSSRHGDLHKTSDLLGELAKGNELSPTAFSLSVHNAVSGLYSIFNNNKSAINATSAGQDSFFMAMVDAYARLKSGLCDKVLLLHVDQVLPETYNHFKDEQQIDHSVALVLRLAKSDEAGFELNFSANELRFSAKDTFPPALVFADWLKTTQLSLAIHSENYTWLCNKYD